MKSLLEKINKRRLRMAIVGLGYVGVPLATEFLKEGFYVAGCDISEKRVQSIQNKTFQLENVDLTDLYKALKKGQFEVSTDYSCLKDIHAVSICVPTPLGKTRDPDLSYIVSSVEAIAKNLNPPQIVILESTTYPGTTEEIVIPIMEKNGWKLDKDYFLAFSPERVDPGNKRFGTNNIPKIIGGQTPVSLKVCQALYECIIEKVYPVSSTRVAEMAKLLENTFRMVNIALVNEIAMMCHHMDLNVWEVIEAAATKPFGFMPFYPGPGLGGHCLPIDPIYLSWKARMMDTEARFIDLAQMINTGMPVHVVELLGEALNNHKKALHGSKIMILGVTYKKDVADIRETPAFDIFKVLIRKGARVSYHDPYVPAFKIDGHAHAHLKEFKSVALTPKNIRSQDALILVTDHSAFNMNSITQHAKLLLDTRNATKNVKQHRQKIVLL